jgi:hypothetical protein
MRTKTLLIAVAALVAAGIVSSKATPVYSANIVGYVNQVLPGTTTDYSVVVNPLVGTTNVADQVLSAIQPGDTLYIWTGTTYYNTTYYGPGNDPNPPYTYNWLDQNNNWTNGPALKPGEGFFYLNNQGVDETNTFVGTVLLTNSIDLTGNPAYSVIGSTPPISGYLDDTNINLPLQPGDTVYIWTGNTYYNSTYYGPGNDPNPPYTYNWLDQNNVWTNAPYVSVGQGFFYLNNQGSDEQWTQSLTVQ